LSQTVVDRDGFRLGLSLGRISAMRAAGHVSSDAAVAEPRTRAEPGHRLDYGRVPF
jgi:hypothetical protein